MPQSAGGTQGGGVTGVGDTGMSVAVTTAVGESGSRGPDGLGYRPIGGGPQPQIRDEGGHGCHQEKGYPDEDLRQTVRDRPSWARGVVERLNLCGSHALSAYHWGQYL